MNREELILKVEAWLTKAGFSFVTYNKEESKTMELRFKGEDERGRFLEFRYDIEDGWFLDRPEGSKYWDILEKVENL